MFNKKYFSNLSCYEELEIKSNLINKPISSIIKKIGKMCDKYYWIIINGEIVFFDRKGNKIKNISKISCDFCCFNTNITTLKGMPLEVGGYFDCSFENISSLKYAPVKVGGGFYCSNTKITSLEGAPNEVGGNFYCNYTKITSLKGSPSKVDMDFSCSYTKITSLKGAPNEVGRDFNCSNTKITSLCGAPNKVGRRFWCDNTNISRKQIDDYLNFLKNPTEDLMDETGHYKPKS